MPEDLETLAEFCRSMGALPPQDRHMASQILKRADQISAERGIERLEAVRELLELMIKAHGGGGNGQGA
jgi:hypothetical protein